MNIKHLAAAAALSFSIPFAVDAAPFDPGFYAATDYNDVRSIWTNPGNSGAYNLVTGGGASNEWTVGTTSVLSFDGTNASLGGTATNNGQSTLMFDFVLNMVADATNMPYCRPAICDNTDESMWTLFDLTSASFTGVAGTAMDGIAYNVTQRSKHGPQAGEGANDKDANELGFSMWFDFTRTDTTTPTGPFTFNASGHGDFNMDLEPTDSNINEVPLPAPAWMLFAALGGLAAARRRTS